MEIRETFAHLHITPKQIAKLHGDRRVGKAEVSAVLNGALLPSVELMVTLCRVTGCKPLELYRKEEIDLERAAQAVEGWQSTDRHRRRHSKSFRIGEEGQALFSGGVLQALQYRDGQHWFDGMVSGTASRYQKKMMREEDRYAGDQTRLDFERAAGHSGHTADRCRMQDTARASRGGNAERQDDKPR